MAELVKILEQIWNVYFPLEEDVFNVKDQRINIILGFVSFLQSESGSPFLSKMNWSVDTHVLVRYNEFLSRCPLDDLDIALFEHPIETLACLSASLALCAPMYQSIEYRRAQRYIVRIQGYNPITPLKDIKANIVGMYPNSF